MALGASFERRDFAGNAVATTLNGAIVGTGAITPAITASTGWPDGNDGPFFILVNSVEQMEVTSRSGTTLTIAAGGRGMGGTSATTHASGVAVVHIAALKDFDEANQMVAILGNGTSGLPLKAGGTATAPAYGTLGAGALASDSVTTAKILDANVTTGKIADAAVTADKVAAAVAGDGLTGGAGTALAVGAGHGLDVTANAVDVDETELDIALMGGTNPAILNTLLTTRGDLIRRGAAAPERVALGTSGQVLTSNGTDAVWGAASDYGGDLRMGVWTAAQTGWALMNGQTITSAQSLYTETWANAPTSWRSGSSLVLPDWAGLMPIMVKSTDTDFDVIGETGGAKTHTHALSSSGWAKAASDQTSNFFRFLKVAATAFTSTDKTVGVDIDSDSNSSTSGIGLGGVTDAGSSMPPFVAVNWAIRLK